MTWIQTIITFLIGYLLGRWEQPEFRSSVQGLAQNVKKKLKKKQKLGAVQTLTPEEMRIRKNPVLKAEDEEMGKVIEEHIL